MYLEKARLLKDAGSLVFIAELFMTVRMWKQPNYDRQKDKEDIVRACNGILLSHKRN